MEKSQKDGKSAMKMHGKDEKPHIPIQRTIPTYDPSRLLFGLDNAGPIDSHDPPITEPPVFCRNGGCRSWRFRSSSPLSQNP